MQQSLLEEFIKRGLSDRTESTKKTYRNVLKNLEGFLQERGRDLAHLDKAALQEYINDRVARNRSPVTVNKELQAIKKFCGWLGKKEMVEKINLRSPPPSPAGEALDQAQKEKLKDEISSQAPPRDRALILLLLATGLKLGETVDLNREDIRYEGEKAFLIIKARPGRGERKIPLDHSAHRALESYLAGREDQEPALFLSNRDCRISPRSVQHILQQYGTSVQKLRATFLAELLESGQDMATIQALSGHRSADMVMRYAPATRKEEKTPVPEEPVAPSEKIEVQPGGIKIIKEGAPVAKPIFEDFGPARGRLNFPDARLEQAIREEIKKPEGDIYPGDVATIEELDAENRGIEKLEGLESLINLQFLNLRKNRVSDLSPLNRLTELEWLVLYDNEVRDVEPLNGLTRMEYLVLDWNDILDIAPLGGLHNLKRLFLHGNGLQNLAPLQNLNHLERLGLGSNSIQEIEPLSKLIQLERLNLYGNKLADITPLAGLVELQWLVLGSNMIQDTGPLRNLCNLERLNLEFNSITDLSPLAGLKQLERLHAYGNNIREIDPLAGLLNLKLLSLGLNRIQNIEALSGLTQLEWLILQFNEIKDIQPLVENEGLGSGDWVSIRQNNLDLQEGSPHLEAINKLKNRGVEVSYEPQNDPPGKPAER